ncbi:hypothetical protein TTHERM_000581749 (macronuclear) [Tetrahymena thermophila SB210]|uniref:Uncharacterized protein n=1 Tax=Tetrahymena thermophila (strain SB210) TaxID=312017 RepID=W7XB57_TETTS|nr:hypothetical protein TTHERM_000581749 [Tetrahymena thermophila SB210]EWS73653.1 hypothetical protein TTHERM_000581749 [Tetrahymena thermophila SB210]|eukprot:XP_012653783.1 hypothetical protein TTHERM_000581749 [Tetrahymena thermophila SB210]
MSVNAEYTFQILQHFRSWIRFKNRQNQFQLLKFPALIKIFAKSQSQFLKNFQLNEIMPNNFNLSNKWVIINKVDKIVEF